MPTCDGLKVRFANFNDTKRGQNLELSRKDFSEVAAKDLGITRKLKFTTLNFKRRKKAFDIDSAEFAELVCRKL